jgi:hypothetical protein
MVQNGQIIQISIRQKKMMCGIQFKIQKTILVLILMMVVILGQLQFRLKELLAQKALKVRRDFKEKKELL